MYDWLLGTRKPLEKNPLEAIDELSCDFSNYAGKISELADHYDFRAVAYR